MSLGNRESKGCEPGAHRQKDQRVIYSPPYFRWKNWGSEVMVCQTHTVTTGPGFGFGCAWFQSPFAFFPLPKLLLSEERLSLYCAIEASVTWPCKLFSFFHPWVLGSVPGTTSITKITRVVTAVTSIVLPVWQALFQVWDR